MGKSKAKKQVKEVYHVEVITRARVVPVDSSEDEEHDRRKKGKKKKKKPLAKWEYYVKWANYDSDANSWEPEENLEGCERLRESFWRHIGMDDRDYTVGLYTNIRSYPAFLHSDKEKAFFKKEFASAQEELERHKKVLHEAKKAKKRKSLKQDSIVVSSRSNKDSESSEDERPLQTILVSPSRKRKRAVSSPSGDEETVSNSKLQKYAKLNDARSTAMDEEDTLPRADSPTSLFSVPSSPDVPLIDSLSSPVPTTNTLTTANVPSTSINFSQQPNPLAQSRSEPTSGGGGISIKQRLGIGALAPTNPKTGLPLVLRPPMSKSLPPSLAGLKIKKIPSLSISTNDNPASGHEPPLRSASMHSPHPTSNMSPNIPNLTPSTSAPAFTPNFYHHVTPNETISPSLISLSPAMDEAEKFLQEIMPIGLADPLLPAQETVVEPPPPMALHPKPALPGRIPKRWQWQGPLYLNASTNLFCSVKIHNITDPKPSEMRFSVAFEGVMDLSMITFHNVLDLRSILSAFRPWTQLAFLSPQEEKDHEPFKVLYLYLEKFLKVILKPIILDNNVIGQILIFPPGLTNMLHHLKLPSGFAQPDNLVVALLPWVLSKPQLIKESRLPNSEPHSLPTLLESDRWTRSIRVKPGYQHALRILGFPEDLHNYMHDRLFSILWNHRTSSKNAGIETKLLLNIMEQARAKPAGHTNEARIVFVHVSALTSLHRLPGLVERRSKRPHVHFYTYGSHEDVSPSLWSVKEIYPCGGIITFSPSAMFHNPIEMLLKIRQINAHSLWECYILPSALGMLAKMVCGDDDPLAVLERGEFSHGFILKAIAAGEVALIHAPPEKATTHSANDDRQIWMRQYLCLTPFTTKRALEIGVQAFHSKYADISESERLQRMETEILTDLSSMQRQPAIMKDYRRYVVFISEQEARSNPNSGGLEWTTLSKFDFKDNFHPNRQIINA